MPEYKYSVAYRVVQFNKQKSLQLIEPRNVLLYGDEVICVSTEPISLISQNTADLYKKLDLLKVATALPVIVFEAALVNATNQTIFDLARTPAEESDIERDLR